MGPTFLAGVAGGGAVPTICEGGKVRGRDGGFGVCFDRMVLCHPRCLFRPSVCHCSLWDGGRDGGGTAVGAGLGS